jgi:hypothetical protein
MSIQWVKVRVYYFHVATAHFYNHSRACTSFWSDRVVSRLHTMELRTDMSPSLLRGDNDHGSTFPHNCAENFGYKIHKFHRHRYRISYPEMCWAWRPGTLRGYVGSDFRQSVTEPHVRHIRSGHDLCRWMIASVVMARSVRDFSNLE